MPNEFGQVQEGIQKIVKSASTGAWRQLTVKVKEFLFINSLHLFVENLAICFEFPRWS
jgi:hypothetical protein